MTEYNTLNNFQFKADGVKIETDTIRENVPTVDRIIFHTEDVPENRVTLKPRRTVEETRTVDGVEVSGETTERYKVPDLPESLRSIVDALQDGDVLEFRATVTEIIPEDSDKVYHSISKNQVDSIQVRKVSEIGEGSEESESDSEGWESLKN